MINILHNPSFLPSCILAGVGIVFLVLVSVLPPMQVFALIGGTVLAIGLVLARLRRGGVESEPVTRVRAEG